MKEEMKGLRNGDILKHYKFTYKFEFGKDLTYAKDIYGNNDTDYLIGINSYKLYRTGEFTAIKGMTLEEIEKELGYEIKIIEKV